MLLCCAAQPSERIPRSHGQPSRSPEAGDGACFIEKPHGGLSFSWNQAIFDGTLAALVMALLPSIMSRCIQGFIPAGVLSLTRATTFETLLFAMIFGMSGPS